LTFAFATLALVAVFLAVLLVISNHHADEVIKKRNFDRGIQDPRPLSTVVSIDKNTAAANLTSSNAANWRGDSAQAASFRTSGRTQ